jgi:hypothetical protein
MGLPGLSMVSSCDEKGVVHVYVLACEAEACTRAMAW